MTDLYLIAHKVRGEPAFDVAEQMTCPICAADPAHDDFGSGCHECDGLGYWWIIPTSGHRAYPYNWACYDFKSLLPIEHRTMPPNLPDHYATRTEPKFDLISVLGLRKPAAPLPPIPRRF